MEEDDKYLISIYNIETKHLEEIFQTETTNFLGESKIINYMINNKYLYICYRNTLDIFDIENNFEHVDIINDVYEYRTDYFLGERRMMKYEKTIDKILCSFSDDLFFGKGDKGKLKLYSFINNNLNVYYEFEYQKIIEIIKLKNGNFVFFSYDGLLYILKPLYSKI